MLPIVVQKFGGSSVADIEKIKRVARKVVETKRAGHGVVVVVSAMGNTTDQLISMARTIHPEPAKREMDMLVSVGERITISLLTMAIHELGEQAISFTGSQSGILTNDTHNRARIIEVRPFRIQDELERDKVVIVAGYQGVSYKREITTLGRGGTDTSAVALTAALGAERCEIYSDVDGVFSADPRIVVDAQKLDELTYDEMLALSRHGAKVLNSEAVAYAKRHQIAIHAKSTFGGPEATGTYVRKDLTVERPLAGVSVLGEAFVLLSEAPLRGDTLQRLIEISERHDVTWTSLTLANGTLLGYSPLVDLREPLVLQADLERELPELRRDEGLGVVCLVGETVHESHVCSRALSIAAERGASLSRLASTHNCLALIESRGLLREIASAWHQSFFPADRK
ncbi:MAG: aspartate kinase [Myxococcales bacterium]|nr:aspartate kinase [Myxococcales bacterium]